MSLLFERMNDYVEIAREKGLLQAYCADFYEYDKTALEEAAVSGDEYFWMIRENGTQLVLLNGQEGSGDFVGHLVDMFPDSQMFLVSVWQDGQDGEVRPVTAEQALKAINRIPLRAHHLPRSENATAALDHVVKGFSQVASNYAALSRSLKKGAYVVAIENDPAAKHCRLAITEKGAGQKAKRGAKPEIDVRLPFMAPDHKQGEHILRVKAWPDVTWIDGVHRQAPAPKRERRAQPSQGTEFSP